MTQKLHFCDTELQFLSACRFNPACMTELLQFCDVVMDFFVEYYSTPGNKTLNVLP